MEQRGRKEARDLLDCAWATLCDTLAHQGSSLIKRDDQDLSVYACMLDVPRVAILMVCKASYDACDSSHESICYNQDDLSPLSHSIVE